MLIICRYLVNMAKIYKIRFFNKIIILTCLLLFPVITSSAEVSDKEWVKKCDKNNKNCLIAIQHNQLNKTSNKLEQIALIYIQIGSKTEKKMTLINEEEKTYELKEKNILVPILFVNLPLNVDLKKLPLLLIDKKKILNLNYTRCNQDVGCQANLTITNDVVKLLKMGKELEIIMGIYSRTENLSVKLPLKNFSKSYSGLFK